ncbi:MAG: hypothetical protein IPM24_20540 [Bryobacterales bacterium]|nr:hypothetical protein [Bryobacterales bacterium]
MSRVACLLLVLFTGFLPVSAQSLRVYSEFRRIDPFGRILRADQGGTVREVLSPAVARNAYASWLAAVTMPPGKPFHFYVAQNPDDRLRLTIYRARYEQHRGEWIPDRLEKIEGLRAGVGPETPVVEGQTAHLFWIDAWVAADTPPERLRVEAQVFVDDRWIIYPMEVRVESARVPMTMNRFVRPAPLTAPATAQTEGPWSRHVCGADPEKANGPLSPSIRRFLQRNAMQDAALAAERKDFWDREWCQAPTNPASQGEEAYLRTRARLIFQRY